MFLIASKNLLIITQPNEGLDIYKIVAYELKKKKKQLSIYGNFKQELYFILVNGIYTFLKNSVPFCNFFHFAIASYSKRSGEGFASLCFFSSYKNMLSNPFISL